VKQLTALDWIAVVLTAGVGAALCCFPIPARSFMLMYRDFKASFPTITRLAFSGWFPVGLGVLALGTLGVSLAPGLTLGRRRFLIVGTFVVGLAALVVLGLGLYWPLWEVADKVR
jgi:hypothetical protein